jgi:hypothetical protein
VAELSSSGWGKLVKKLTKLEGEPKISKAAQKQLDKWLARAKKGK